MMKSSHFPAVPSRPDKPAPVYARWQGRPWSRSACQWASPSSYATRPQLERPSKLGTSGSCAADENARRLCLWPMSTAFIGQREWPSMKCASSSAATAVNCRNSARSALLITLEREAAGGGEVAHSSVKLQCATGRCRKRERADGTGRERGGKRTDSRCRRPASEDLFLFRLGTRQLCRTSRAQVCVRSRMRGRCGAAEHGTYAHRRTAPSATSTLCRSAIRPRSA